MLLRPEEQRTQFEFLNLCMIFELTVQFSIFTSPEKKKPHVTTCMLGDVYRREPLENKQTNKQNTHCRTESTILKYVYTANRHARRTRELL